MSIRHYRLRLLANYKRFYNRHLDLAAVGVETETVTSPVAATAVRQSRYGLVLTNAIPGTTTASVYDPLGRVAATARSVGTTGCQPVAAYSYSPCGDLVSVRTHTNGVGTVCETYAYDMLGNRVATTDALGNTTCRAFDPLGNVAAEWGAAYPVRRTYDTQGRRTSLATTRDGTVWDTTTWAYDPRTGSCLSKTYADGSTVTYAYTPDNLPLRTTYASGRWQENVYDARRQIVAVEYSDGEIASFDPDAFLNEIAFSNDVASTHLDRDAKGNCTNDTAVVGDETKATRRTFDEFSRLTGIDGAIYDYNADGLLASISNAIAVVDYAYTPDRLDSGYSLTLSNGVLFTRCLARDGYRRSLVTDISAAANGAGVGNLAYTYDALNRPTARNADTFGYNARGEVATANIFGVSAAYGYDEIGNSTNWTANCRNQYIQFTYDLDGNMTQCGDWTYTYDAANRLKTVSSNGMQLVTNFYDAKSRRVKKVTSDATTTFFYDGWNLVEERIAYTNGATSTIRYYWGKDVSGTLQGAGGIGGLLYLTIGDAPFVPCYDANGNVTRYLDASGRTVAEYVYAAFGNLLSQSGPLADAFRFRFSTKYHDAETGLCYYGYRFYSPALMRWLTRDPIEEEGGLNLYGFCGNDAVGRFDRLGQAHFEVRALRGLGMILPYSCFAKIIGVIPAVALDFGLADKLNVEILHEHLFYDDGTNVGYSKEGLVTKESKAGYSRRDGREYDDCIMKEAQSRVSLPPYSLIGWGRPKYNCQDYADSLRRMYDAIKDDPEVKCKCKKGRP